MAQYLFERTEELGKQAGKLPFGSFNIGILWE
jgi:hypothetical protein